MLFTRVKLEGQESSVLGIRGNVVEGGLELLSYVNDERIECIKFGSTYYGTDKTESGMLYNNGPEPVCFVAVLDEDAVGQEMVGHQAKSYMLDWMALVALVWHSYHDNNVGDV